MLCPFLSQSTTCEPCDDLAPLPSAEESASTSESGTHWPSPASRVTARRLCYQAHVPGWGPPWCGVHLCQGVWVGGHTLHFIHPGDRARCSQHRAPGPGRGEGHPLGQTETPLPRAGEPDPLWAVGLPQWQPAPFQVENLMTEWGELKPVSCSNEEEDIYKHIHCTLGQKKKLEGRLYYHNLKEFCC